MAPSVTSFDNHLFRLMKCRGNLKEIKNIISNGKLYKVRDSEKNTFLHYASKYGDFGLVEHLIKSGSKVNVQNSDGETPLMLATTYNEERIFDALIKAGADISKRDRSGRTPLERIGQRDCVGSRQTFQHILKKLQRDCLDDREKVAEKLFDANWRLYQIVQFEDAKLTKIILERNYVTNIDETVGYSDNTALHNAVRYADVENVQVLLEFNANINALNRDGRKPLYYVYEYHGANNSSKCFDILKMLLERSNSKVIDAQQVYHVLQNGTKEAIKLLFDHNLDPMTIADSIESNAVVHVLAENTNLGVIQQLQHKTFNLDARNGWGETPLMLAAESGNVNAVEFLLIAGANIDYLDHDGQTALFYAVQFDCNITDRREECVQALLERGANVQIQTNLHIYPSIFDTILTIKSFPLAKLIVSHIALQEAKGTPITQLIREKIDSHDVLKTHFEASKQQIFVKINETITLYDLLVAADKKLERYVCNDELVTKIQDIFNSLSSNNYFYNLLQKRLMKANEIVKLKEESISIICQIMLTDYSGYPYIVDQIIDYLEKEDMKNLIDALS